MEQGVERNRLRWPPKREFEYRFANAPRQPAAGIGGRPRPATGGSVAGEHHACVCSQAATATIPIDVRDGVDPVEAGLVASFNGTGANVTGVTSFQEARSEAIGASGQPRIGGHADRHVGAYAQPQHRRRRQRRAGNGGRVGENVLVERVASIGDLDAAVAALVQQRVAALFVAPQADFRNWRQQILMLVERHALATSFSNRDFVVAGGLMSYGPNQLDSYREAGIYTGRILKGEKPAELPVMVSTKFDFVINLDCEGPYDPSGDARACH